MRERRDLCMKIFLLIGVACTVAAVVAVILGLLHKKRCECEFDFDDDDDDYDDYDEYDDCAEKCCDENGCAYTGEEDFEK